jgi:hypothetical protein
MAVLFSISALIFTITKIPQGECSIKQAFFRIKEQKYLANIIMSSKTKQAESELQCGILCVRDGSCTSVNYKTSGIGKGLCELNSKTFQEISNPDENMHNIEFNHLYIIKNVRILRTHEYVMRGQPRPQTPTQTRGFVARRRHEWTALEPGRNCRKKCHDLKKVKESKFRQ